MSDNRYEDNYWDISRNHLDRSTISPNPLRQHSKKSDYSIKNVREDSLRSIDKRKRRIPKRSSTPFKPREIPQPLSVRQKEKRKKQQKRIELKDKIKAKLKIDENSLLLFEKFSDTALEEERNKKKPALSRSLKKIMETETKASRSVKDKQLSSLFTSTILNKNKTE